MLTSHCCIGVLASIGNVVLLHHRLLLLTGSNALVVWLLNGCWCSIKGITGWTASTRFCKIKCVRQPTGKMWKLPLYQEWVWYYHLSKLTPDVQNPDFTTKHLIAWVINYNVWLHELLTSQEVLSLQCSWRAGLPCFMLGLTANCFPLDISKLVLVESNWTSWRDWDSRLSSLQVDAAVLGLLSWYSPHKRWKKQYQCSIVYTCQLTLYIRRDRRFTFSSPAQTQTTFFYRERLTCMIADWE